jgi:hypothetical protein
MSPRPSGAGHGHDGGQAVGDVWAALLIAAVREPSRRPSFIPRSLP